MGAVDAYCTGGNIWKGAFIGASGGRVGGVLSPVEAVAERQIAIYLLLNFDIEGVDQVANAINSATSN